MTNHGRERQSNPMACVRVGSSLNGARAAKVVVQQRADRHVLETRYNGLNGGCLYENGFRKSQPIDLLCGNDHYLMPLENDRFREISAWG